MENSEVLMPLLFIAGSFLMSALSLAFMKWKKEGERERARAAARELGLEFLSKGEAYEDPESGDPFEPRVRRLALIPRPIRRLLAALSSWSMEGRYAGLRVTLYTETRSSGRSSATYTVIRAYYLEPLPFAFRAAKEGIFAKLGKSLFGLEDIELGAREFDEAIRVKAADPSQARLLLSRAGLAEAFVAVVRRHPSVRAEQEFVHWERRGVATGAVEFREILDSIVPIARAIGG